MLSHMVFPVAILNTPPPSKLNMINLFTDSEVTEVVMALDDDETGDKKEIITTESS